MGYGQYSENRSERSNPLPAKKTRQKQVFASYEIPHLWAYKTQEKARNAQGNFYFDGDTIYSYGSHFPIARHVTVKGKSAILLTTRTYSNTTRGQIHSVKCAIPPTVQVFHVHNVDAPRSHVTHDGNIAERTEALNEAILKASRARSGSAWLIGRATGIRENLLGYCKFFKLKAPKLPTVPENAAERERNAEQVERNRVAKAAIDALNAMTLQERITAWRSGKHITGYLLYDTPTMLRRAGDTIETSHGASFPVDHARKALTLIHAVIARGETWETNGHTCHLGHYQIDRIDANGTVTAGCHVVPFSEIQMIEIQLKAGS